MNLRSLPVFLAMALAASGATPSADSARGAEVFRSQSCAQCHTMSGSGPNIGPDLSRLVDRGFTPASFASTLWNHAPTMLGAMRARNIQPPVLDEQAAADLFAFFYSTRSFEEPADAGRGKRIFTARGCTSCHGITESKVPEAKPASQWTSLSNPIALIEAMWNHAANMREEMAKQKISWPVLSGQDVADLLVYLRNLPSASPKPAAVFQTVSADNGKALFDSKGCAQCHKSADTFLAAGLPGQTMTDIAAEMWNHGREMSGAGLSFAPGEMGQIASYIWSRRMFENSGSAGRGRTIFAKDCATCHGNASSGAPVLTPGAREYTDITMVSAVWKHASATSAQGKAWPRLDTHEMSDLIAYLNSKGSSSAR